MDRYTRWHILLLATASIALENCATAPDEGKVDPQIAKFVQQGPHKLLRKETTFAVIPNGEYIEATRRNSQYRKDFRDLVREDSSAQTRILAIKQLLQNHNKIEKKYHLYVELAKLHIARHDFGRRLELSHYLKKLKAWKKNPSSHKKPTLSHKASAKHLYAATNVLRNLVRDFPQYKAAEQHLFDLVKTLARLGNENVEYYSHQFKRQYLNSDKIPEVYFYLGEYYLDQGDLKNAISSYKKAMEFKGSQVYPYAVYKLGWTYFIQGSQSEGQQKKFIKKFIKKSIAAFKLTKKVLSKEKWRDKSASFEADLNFDLGYAWAKTEELTIAYNYFHKINNIDSFYDCLALAADFTTRNEDYKKAIKIYEQLLNEAKTRFFIPEMHINLIALYYRTGKQQKIAPQLRALVALYDKHHPWRRANTTAGNDIYAHSYHVRRTVYDYGFILHEDAQKKGRKDYLQIAEKIYRLYLVSFFDNIEEICNIRYNLASIYFLHGKYDQSAIEFSNVVDLFPKNRQLQMDAAYNAILATSNLDKAQKPLTLPTIGKVTSPIAVPPVKVKLIKAIDRFCELFPKEQRVTALRYEAAVTYLSYGHYDEAIKRFEGIFIDQPATEQGQNSLKLIVAFLYDKGKWGELVKRLKKYLAIKSIIDAGLEKFLMQNLAEATAQRDQLSNPK